MNLTWPGFFASNLRARVCDCSGVPGREAHVVKAADIGLRGVKVLYRLAALESRIESCSLAWPVDLAWRIDDGPTAKRQQAGVLLPPLQIRDVDVVHPVRPEQSDEQCA